MKPTLWKKLPGGDVACPHRDVSVCSTCAAAYPEVVEVVGAHFWVDSPQERADLRRCLAINFPDKYPQP